MLHVTQGTQTKMRGGPLQPAICSVFDTCLETGVLATQGKTMYPNVRVPKFHVTWKAPPEPAKQASKPTDR